MNRIASFGMIRPLRLLVLLSSAGLLAGLAPTAAAAPAAPAVPVAAAAPAVPAAAGALIAGAAPAVQKPGTPTSVVASVGDGWAQLEWQPPTTGGPVGKYQISYQHAGRRITQELAAGARSYRASGLTNGTSYSVILSALNAAGQGAETVRVTPRVTPPGEFALTSLTKRMGVIVVTWSESSAGTYPLGRYTVQLYRGYSDALATTPVVARSAVVRPGGDRVATFIDLDPTATYFVRVIASDNTVAQAYWPVGTEHQRTADRLNGFIWSIRPS